MGTFSRKFWLFGGTDLDPNAYLPPDICPYFCRTDIIFYGLAKLLIYWQLYSKVQGVTKVEGNPKRARRILRIVVGTAAIGFIVGFIIGSAYNSPIIKLNSCVCRTQQAHLIIYVTFDWILSGSLLTVFIRAALSQLRSPDNPQIVLWRRVAIQQLTLAIVMLVISPALMGWFTYIASAINDNITSLEFGALPTVDLTISCYCQAIVSRKLWGKTKHFFGTIDERDAASEERLRPFLSVLDPRNSKSPAASISGERNPMLEMSITNRFTK
jgi:hypothetical protein